MTKPNKDGWIRHRGKIQTPVEPGTIIDVRYRNGDIDEASEVGKDEEWLHEGSPYDVMAWRPHKPDQPNIIGFMGVEEIPVQTEKDGPIQWRDRIREIDAASKEEEARHCAAMAAYDSERASLVAKLKDEGFLLIQSDEPNSAADSAQKDIAQQDMSDPANWRVGDLVKSVNDEADDILIGGVYPLWKEPDIDGDCLYLIDSDGDKRNRCIEDYEFHSRPTN